MPMRYSAPLPGAATVPPQGNLSEFRIHTRTSKQFGIERQGSQQVREALRFPTQIYSRTAQMHS